MISAYDLVCLVILGDRVNEEIMVLKWTGLRVEPESWESWKGPSHFFLLFIWFGYIGRAIVVVLLSLSLGIVDSWLNSSGLFTFSRGLFTFSSGLTD